MNSQHRPGSSGADSIDVLTRAARLPDLTLRYGDLDDQVADVHLPPTALAAGVSGGGRVLLTIFLHGGFWRSEYGRVHTAPLAEALAESGFAVCAPEYRRTGQPDGGWPGTFDDVAVAVDRLPSMVAEATGGLVDPDRFVLAGHSAGGHLALWAASRHRLPASSPWHTAQAGKCRVVALAPVSDLAACYRRQLGGQAAGALMGGSPEDHRERYLEADPIGLVPAGVPIWLVHGTADDRVPCDLSLGYAMQARAAGAVGPGAATCVLLPGAGHFELIDPLTEEWPNVVDVFHQAAGWQHDGSQPAGRLTVLLGHAPGSREGRPIVYARVARGSMGGLR
jgi:acetyl esterase/lipase